MKIYEKDYYNLKELIPIVNLKYRQLKERIKTISEKYISNKELIYKKSNMWHIHNSIIKEFERKRCPINYKYFVTISSKNRFDIDYWKYCVNKNLYKKLKGLDINTRVKYVIESNVSIR